MIYVLPVYVLVPLIMYIVCVCYDLSTVFSLYIWSPMNPRFPTTLSVGGPP